MFPHKTRLLGGGDGATGDFGNTAARQFRIDDQKSVTTDLLQ
jgi:hypothetical protein